jgi:hypothetical protein
LKPEIVPYGSLGRRTTLFSFFGANDVCEPEDCVPDASEPVSPVACEPVDDESVGWEADDWDPADCSAAGYPFG